MKHVLPPSAAASFARKDVNAAQIAANAPRTAVKQLGVEDEIKYQLHQHDIRKIDGCG